MSILDYIGNMKPFDALLEDKLNKKVQELQSPFMPQTSPQPPGALNMLERERAMAPPDTSVMDKLAQINAGQISRNQGVRDLGGRPAGLGNKLFDKIGLPQVGDFIGSIGDSLQRAAERGQLGAVAPKFQAGVSEAMNRKLQEAYQNAMLEVQRERNAISREGNFLSASTSDKRRVQSTQVLGNGNLGVVMNDPSAEGGYRIIDTGQKASGKGQVFTIPGMGTFRYDPVTDETVNMQDDAAIQDALRAQEAAKAGGAAEGQREGADIASAQGEAPKRIQVIDENIGKIDGFIADLESGNLNTGSIIEGKFSQFTDKGQLFDAFSKTRVLDLISSATFGALSEGERAFLADIAFGLSKDEEVNIKLLKEYKRILQKAREIEAGTIERAQEANPTAMQTQEERLAEKGIKAK